MRKIRAKIVHLSDLHFGGNIDKKLLKQLSRVLQDIEPNFLIISGDLADSPLPSSIKKASEYINELIYNCNIRPERTLAVPGNHDYKFWGNFGLRRLSRIPFEIYFRDHGISLTKRNRWGLYLKYALKAIWPWSDHIGDQLQIRYDERSALAIFGINSTPLFELFATGKVNEEQISMLTDKITNTGGPNKFTQCSFTSWQDFIKCLKGQDASKYSNCCTKVFGLMGKESKDLIESLDAEDVWDENSKNTVINDLNNILENENLHKINDFECVQLKEEAQKIIDKTRSGPMFLKDKKRINRLLLESIFDKNIFPSQEWGKIFKIAVVHHHPIPIPYIGTKYFENIKSSFTIFFNAGTFLRELANAGINLILHGHNRVKGGRATVSS